MTFFSSSFSSVSAYSGAPRSPWPVLSVVVLLLALLAPTQAAPQTDRRLPAPTQPPSGVAPRLALVVGNDRYPSAPLRNAAADARAVAAALRDVGFSVTELLNATTPDLERALREMAGRLTPQAEVVFFYAGHGVQIDGENFLVPADFGVAGADAIDLKARSLASGTVLDRFAGARVRVVMLDACRDNPFAASRSASGGLAALQATGALVAFATGPGQTASDNPSGANGLFTTHLLSLLRQPGLSAVDLFRRVRQQVYDASGGKQTPWLSDGLLGDFVFNRAAPVRRNLTVETSPPGATVLVDGQPRGLASPQLIVSGLGAGEHDVAVQRDGYAEAHRRVTIGADADASVSLTLTAESGGLRLETTPLGAQVAVDGLVRGVAPLDVGGLAPGAHRVEATLGGYVPFYGDMTVRAGEAVAVRASLARESRGGADATTGILHVTSDPPGAQVYLDGILVGTTPHTQEAVPVGSHRVRVSKTYYAPADATVDVAAKVVVRRDEKLRLLSAALTVESDFGVGTLSIDGGDARPLQPSQAVQMTAGHHLVRINHPTAGAIEEQLDLIGGPQRVAFRKGAWLGAITILNDVPITDLEVNHRPAGFPPLTVSDLPRGTTEIVGYSGDGRVTKTAIVVAGDTVVVRLSAADVKAMSPAELAVVRANLRWVRIPAGTFQMGCVPADTECDADEKPRHAVTLTKPFELMTTEVTIATFHAYAQMPAQPDWNTDEPQPVVNVTWDEANALCGGVGGRLPTEAEWEYAARGGREGEKFPWGNAAPSREAGGSTGARFGGSGPGTAVGATYAPNGYGLYDMAGNVWEWVADWSKRSYPMGAVTDPRGPSSGANRVVRGGSWGDGASELRVSYRGDGTPGTRGTRVGFRCARDVSP